MKVNAVCVRCETNNRRCSDFMPDRSAFFPSENFDRVSCEPDVELLKASFELLFVSDEELAIGRSIGDVDKHAHEFITIALVVLSPLTANDLSFCGHRSKPLLQLCERLREESVGDGMAVVKPQRKQDFVLAERTAHRSLVLRPEK